VTDVTEKFGTEPRLVGDRYELGGGIGYGGMAEVYRGRDVRLGREVAIKVLRSDLARDPTFLARFRREAQSSAGLNHPAIVSVYDTGEDVINGVHLPYIVMEFIEGRTLREVLQSEHRLPERRAMEITSDICAALDYSHRMGIIHRDIKPANVMLCPDGSVKVMDFGIARATTATSSTMTATAAVIGTAQYLSPEQARGARVDARSDVYSTGVLFYELLTGEPPFRGDNPVAVAYQHVRELPDPPSVHDPQLSAQADAITLKALEKEPDDRYTTAGDMRDDLERALAGRRVHAMLPAAGPPPGGHLGPPTAAATQVVGAAGYQDRYDTGYQDPYGDPRDRTGAYQGYDDPYGDPRARTGAYQRYDDGSQDDGPPPRQGSAAWKWVLAGLAIVLTFVVVSLVATSLFSSKGNGGGSGAATQATIPTALIGQPVAVVKTRLEGLGFTNVTTTSQESVDKAENTVLAIKPDEGSTLPTSTAIVLTVAIKPGAVSVPDVTGKTQDAAVTTLQAANFKTTVQDFTDPTSHRAGTVEKTDPAANSSAPAGSTITVYVVSSSVNVLDQTGRPASAAQAALQQLGVTVTVQQVASNQPAGTVVDQQPKNATVDRGSTVTLYVSQGAATPSPSPTSSSSPSPTTPVTTSPAPTDGTTNGGTGGGGPLQGQH
jgi:serine/threonine-protein kinase